MSISITPNICFTPSIFYDRNHNPLNIPCEGPKVFPLSVDIESLPEDGIIIVDFNQLFTSGQMTSLQSMALDMVKSGNFSPLIISTGGINENIAITPSNYNSLGSICFPLSAINPAKIRLDLSSYIGSFGTIGFQFFNYMHPIFTTITQGGA